MAPCVLDYDWPWYTLAALVSFVGGFFIQFSLWLLCRNRNISWYSENQCLDKIQSMADSIISGNNRYSKVLVVLFWLVDISSFVLFVIEANMFDVNRRDVCGPVSEPVHVLWILAMTARLIHFIIAFLEAKDKLRFWVQLEMIIDHFVIIPTFVGIYYNRNWLGFRFLTSVYLLKSTDVLETIYILKSGFWISTLKSILKLLVIWLLGAGMFVLTENMGDPFPPHHYKNSQHLSFGNSMYFVLITLSTIGFGDFSPHTVIGRIAMVFYILSALAVFANLIPELGNAIGNRSKYRKAYKGIRRNDHIVFCGGPTFETLSNVVQNFITDVDSSDKTKDMVIIDKNEPSDEMLAYFRRKFNGVTFIEGSVLNIPTLELAKIKTADAIFILANRAASDQNESDWTNIMRTAAIKNFSADVRTIVQLFQHQNKDEPLMIPSWKNVDSKTGKPVPDEVVCISELKMLLMAQNCLARGCVTLISNLMCTRSFKSKRYADWMRNYQYGAGHEIYAQTFSSQFAGKTFTQAALLCFDRYGVLLLAVESRNRIYLNAGDNFILTNNDVGLFIAQDFKQVRKISKSRPQHERLSVESYSSASKEELWTDPSKSKETTRLTGVSSGMHGAKYRKYLEETDAGDMKMRLTKGESDAKSSKVGLKFLSGTETKHWCPARSIEEATLKPDSIEKSDLHDHVIFLLQSNSNDNKPPSIGLVSFVRPLRSSSIASSQLKPIVFYTDLEIIKNDWPSVENYPQIYIYQRTKHLHSDLSLLNVHSTSMVLLMTDVEMANVDDTLIDRSTILTTMNLISYKRLNSRFPMLVQLDYDDSLPYIDDEDDDELSVKPYQTVPYACGQVLLSTALDSMVATAYQNSKISRLIYALLLGEEGSGSRTEGDGQSTEATDSTTGGRWSIISLLSLKEDPLLQLFQNYSNTYGRLVMEALTKLGILFLGIYRLHPNHNGSQKRYVITNPKSDFLLEASDMIYALKPSDLETPDSES